MSPRSTWTSVAVRAEDVKSGEVVLLGGLCFTRLIKDGPLTKTAFRQKARFVTAMNVSQQDGWVEIMFKGGDSPANERVMFALFRPYEIVKVQVERA